MLKCELIKHLQELKLCTNSDYFMPEEPGKLQSMWEMRNVINLLYLFIALICTNLL